MKEALEAKLIHYSSLKAELISASDEGKIAEDLAKKREELENEFKAYEEKIRAEYKAAKDEDIKKVDHYLELLRDLISEEAEKEAKAAEVANEENSEVATPVAP